MVATGLLCHERRSRIGQPEIEYRYEFSCKAKRELTLQDFTQGAYRIIAFLNKPKGT